jgi:hypothetical protein
MLEVNDFLIQLPKRSFWELCSKKIAGNKKLMDQKRQIDAKLEDAIMAWRQN